MSVRTNIMQQAFDEVLDKSAQNHAPALSRSAMLQGSPGTSLRRHPATESPTDTIDWPRTPLCRRPTVDALTETPERPSLSMGLSRPSVPNSLSRHYAQSSPASRDWGAFRPSSSALPRVQREPQEFSPHATLQWESGRESDRMPLPPAGKTPLARASSAPYFVNRPQGNDRFMEDARSTDRGTSHYTTLGGPRTNQNYGHTLPGANMQFCSLNPWKTSSQVFYQTPDIDPEPYRARDPNFQYVNGEKYQGFASVRQRVRLPAHHSSPFSFC